MTIFDRLDEAVLSRWCPLEALGWAAVLSGAALTAGAAVTVAGLQILKDVIT